MRNIGLFFRDLAVLLANMTVPIFRSLRQNSGLAALSVVLAFGVWIVVTDAENPETTRVLDDVDIPVEPIEVPEDIAVETIEPQTIRVRVRVEEDELDTFTPADFAATVNLQGFPIGEHTQPVTVRALVDRGGLRVEEVIPPEVTVTLVDLASAEVGVDINVQGELPPEFRSGQPVPERETVSVEGAPSRVSQVVRATGTIDIGGRTESVTQSIRLEPRDERGQLVTNVVVNPATVEVTVDIEQEVFSKPVVVSPVIVGEPADGYVVTSITTNPVTVTISGSEERILDETSIDTEEIDIGGEASGVVETVALVAPVDINVVGVSQVTVLIEITPLGDSSITRDVGVQAENVPAGLSVSGVLPNVAVTLSGPVASLLAIEDDGVTATVDLSGLGVGSHQAEVEVTVSGGGNIDAVALPAIVTVVLVES